MAQNKKLSRLIGILFLLTLLSYGAGNGIIESVLQKPDYLQTFASIKRSETRKIVSKL